MVLLHRGMTAALSAFTLLGSASAVPLADKLKGLSQDARDFLKGSIPAAPRFVIYNDACVSPLPNAAELQGYSVYILSFWLTSGPADMAMVWQQLSESQRASYLNEYNNAGISVIVSAFGATTSPTTSGADAVTVANELASWVCKYGLQGVDIDYGDFVAFNRTTPTAEPWLITLTQQLRKHLPKGKYILSHAPVAPWFSPNMWSGGGYLGIHKSVGDLIDWYNVQFYNQGTTEYTTCHGLLIESSSNWPESSLFQIATHGVGLDKLVIGKPSRKVDASNGYMPIEKLACCVLQAHAAGWDAGVMVFEYPYARSAWITAVRGNTF